MEREGDFTDVPSFGGTADGDGQPPTGTTPPPTGTQAPSPLPDLSLHAAPQVYKGPLVGSWDKPNPVPYFRAMHPVDPNQQMVRTHAFVPLPRFKRPIKTRTCGQRLYRGPIALRA